MHTTSLGNRVGCILFHEGLHWRPCTSDPSNWLSHLVPRTNLWKRVLDWWVEPIECYGPGIIKTIGLWLSLVFWGLYSSNHWNSFSLWILCMTECCTKLLGHWKLCLLWYPMPFISRILDLTLICMCLLIMMIILMFIFILGRRAHYMWTWWFVLYIGRKPIIDDICICLFVLGMDPEAHDWWDVCVERAALENMSNWCCVEREALEHMSINICVEREAL